MPNFHGDAGFATDAQCLVDRCQNAGAFIAHMRGVNAAEPGSLRGEGDQLFGLGVRGRSVFERSGNAHGAVAHGLAHDSPHLLQLPECRLDVVVAEYHAPDARGAYIAGNVDPGMLLFEAGKVFAKSAPVDVNAIVIVLFLIGFENGVIQWGDRFALAGDFRGDSLIDLGRQARIDKDCVFRLPEHVDEAGSDDLAARVDSAGARRVMKIPDGGNLSVANSKIARIPGRACAIDDVAVSDDDVVRLLRALGFDGNGTEEQDHG